MNTIGDEHLAAIEHPAIAVPAGIVLTRRPVLRQWGLGFANIMQTVPSLALFGFLIPLLGSYGIGRTPAIIALFLYSLLPIIRNTFTGINGVDPAVREAAKGMGMTDAQMLAQVELPLPEGAAGMPGVIVPRKTVGEMQRLIEDNEGELQVELSTGKVRFTVGDVVLTSKLIDGTFPDYGRVIPAGNDKELVVDKKDFEAAVDRVSTVSSERGRAVKLALSSGRLVLTVTNPDSGSATEELEVDYSADALDIGFNSRYLLDIAAQIEGDVAVLKLADPGSPTLIQDKDAKGALYVLMPMRV